MAARGPRAPAQAPRSFFPRHLPVAGAWVPSAARWVPSHQTRALGRAFLRTVQAWAAPAAVSRALG
ncbi:hypothetical protein NX96_14160 [Staphylococcus aureus]|nr:hypothetical protein NX96_14160 [Staphylococcus aureus]